MATGGKDFGDAAKKTAAYGTDAAAGQFPLKAVKEGRAKDVPDETWYLGLGVTAANPVLDDLRADLVT